MNLTTEQQQAIENGQAVEVEVNGRKCALMPLEVYQRVTNTVTDDWPPEEMARAAWEAGKTIGWDDPEMKKYDDYERHRS